MPRLLSPAAAALVLSAGIAAAGQPAQVATLQPAMTVNSPMMVASPPGDPDTLFVLRRNGVVQVWRDGEQVGTFVTMATNSSFECGLFDIAFDPEFAQTGHVYFSLCENAPSRVSVVRYTASAKLPDVADPASRLPILNVPQSAANHNGGGLLFDGAGMLVLSLGDDSNSARARELNRTNGKLLRVDPRTDAFPDDATRHYSIPADNPFVGQPGTLPEIAAFGLRNPWRITLDPPTGNIWISDVGGGSREEISVLRPGGPVDFEWPCSEGSLCRSNSMVLCGPTPCQIAGATGPVFDYDRSLGNTVTGGSVYRGGAIPRWRGRYFFADFYSGRVLSLRLTPGGQTVGVREHTEFGSVTSISSIAPNGHGELYLTRLFSHEVLKLTPVATPGDWNLDGQTNTADITAYLSDWFASRARSQGSEGSLDAEFDGDNVVTTADITAFLSAWFADRGG